MKTQKQDLGKVSLTCNGTWDAGKQYDRLCIVNDGNFASYISKKDVPIGTVLSDERFWQPVANLRDDIKIDYETFKKEWLELLTSIQVKLRSARLVVANEEARNNLTWLEVAAGCEVYELDTQLTYILDSIVPVINLKSWHLVVGSLLGSEAKFQLDGNYELTAEQAIADRGGYIIDEVYVSKKEVKNLVLSIITDKLENMSITIPPNSIKPEDLSQAVFDLIGSGGNVVNNPDEEDITVKNLNNGTSVLKFKDRNYVEGSFNGMGKVILRKNQVGQINLLEQVNINKSNTIYVIRYDFCLGGKTIVIPENCVLEFDGGSFKEGAINFNKSVIKGEFKIDNIIITGNYISSVIAPINSTKEVLQSIVDGKSFQSNEVLVINFSDNHVYNWEGSLLINKKNIKLVGGGIIYGHIQIGITDTEFLELGYNSNNTLSNFNIEISGLTFKKEESDRTDNWVYLTSFQRDDIKGQAIQLLNVIGVNISNCIFNNVPYGIVYGNNPQYVNQNVRRITISNNRFERTNGAVVTIPHGIDNSSQYEYTEYGDTVIIGNTMYCAEYCLDLEGIDGALISSNKMFTANKGDIIIKNTYNINIIGNNMFGESCEKFMVVFRNKCNKIVINGNIFNYFKLNPNNLSDRTFETRDQGAIGFESTVTTSGCIISGNGFYNINAGTPIVIENGSQITALSIMGNEYSNVLNLPLPIINNRGAILGSFECDYKVSNDPSYIAAFNGETLDYTEENIYNTYVKVLNSINKSNSYPNCIVNTKHGEKYVTIDKVINGKAIIILIPTWSAAGGNSYSFLLDNVYYKVTLDAKDTPIQYLTKVINAIPSEFYDTWIIGGVGYIKAKEEGLIRCPFMKTPASNNLFNICNFNYGWNVEYKENGKTLVSDNVYSHELPQYLTKSDDGLHIHLNRVDTNYQTEIIFRTNDSQNTPLNNFSFDYLINPTSAEGYQILFVKNIFEIAVNTKDNIDSINNNINTILTQIYSDVCSISNNRITITSERQLRPVKFLYMLSGSNPVISNIVNKTNSYYFTNIDGTLISNVIIAEKVSEINSVGKIYKIVSDIDLNGETLTIPYNCTLDFQGGSFSNGTIVGNGTKIIAGLTKIFGTDITLNGTWNCSDIYDSWFTQSEDSFTLLQNLCNLTSDNYYGTIYINGNHDVVIPENALSIKPNSRTTIILEGNIIVTPNNFTNYYIFRLIDKNNITIKGGGFLIGDVETHTGTTGEWGHGIFIQGCYNININNLQLKNFWGDGIEVDKSSSNLYTSELYLSNLTIYNNRRQGISLLSVKNVFIDNCVIYGIGSINGTNPKGAIDIEPEGDDIAENIFISNCIEYSNGLGLSAHNTIKNITVDNCTFLSAQGIWHTGDIIFKNCSFGRYFNLEGDIIKFINCDMPITNIISSNLVEIDNCRFRSKASFDTVSDKTSLLCFNYSDAGINKTCKVKVRNSSFDNTKEGTSSIPLVRKALAKNMGDKDVVFENCSFRNTLSYLYGSIQYGDYYNCLFEVPSLALQLYADKAIKIVGSTIVKNDTAADRAILTIESITKNFTEDSIVLFLTGNIFQYSGVSIIDIPATNTNDKKVSFLNNLFSTRYISEESTLYINLNNKFDTFYYSNSRLDYQRYIGNTSNRGTPSINNAGITYFDTDLNKLILWNGTAWTNLDGTTL